jgi:hypothetical protein
MEPYFWRQNVHEGKLHNEELHNLYSLPNIIRMIKSRRMRWIGHGVEEKCIYDIGGKIRRKETARKTKTWVGGQY